MTLLNPQEQHDYDKLIEEWEKHYHETKEQDGLPDNSIARAGFYSACLKVLRAGPPFRYPKVRKALIEHYTKLRDEEFAKLTIPNS